jgi:hypothetical protein
MPWYGLPSTQAAPKIERSLTAKDRKIAVKKFNSAQEKHAHERKRGSVDDTGSVTLLPEVADEVSSFLQESAESPSISASNSLSSTQFHGYTFHQPTSRSIEQSDPTTGLDDVQLDAAKFQALIASMGNSGNGSSSTTQSQRAETMKRLIFYFTMSYNSLTIVSYIQSTRSRSRHACFFKSVSFIALTSSTLPQGKNGLIWL